MAVPRHCPLPTSAAPPNVSVVSAPLPSTTPAAAAASYPRLVSDIGGTNARFAFVAQAGAAPAHLQTLSVPAFAGPAEAATAYLGDLQARLGAAYRAPRRASFAVATAVQGDQVVFTNSRWSFSRESVRQALGLDALVVLNDFEALALSLPHLHPAQWRAHGAAPAGGEAALGTVVAVVGPGTGLGVGAVLRTASGWQALPGEGGHATLSASDALESEVIAVVRRQFPHVSAERLLSGIGLPLLHAALAEVRGLGAVPATGAEAIVNAAGTGDPLAAATLELFCALLGSFAGNVALTLGARGGLYVGGGIVPRFADRFFASAFRERFEAKGRLRDYLSAVPTALIVDTHAALSGAALAADLSAA